MRDSKKPPIAVKVLTDKAAEAVLEYRFQVARARLATRIEEADLSEEEIMAEIRAFRAGK